MNRGTIETLARSSTALGRYYADVSGSDHCQIISGPLLTMLSGRTTIRQFAARLEKERLKLPLQRHRGFPKLYPESYPDKPISNEDQVYYHAMSGKASLEANRCLGTA